MDNNNSSTSSPASRISDRENDRTSLDFGGSAQGEEIIPDPTSPKMGTYPGGKNGSGVYQRIINWIPPHESYLEPFLGGGGIMKAKKSAKWNVGADIDYEVIKKWSNPHHVQEQHGGWLQIPIPGKKETMNIVYDCAITVINRYKNSWNVNQKDLFIFCDPPYIMETRSSPGRIYKYEYTAEQHVDLLKLLVSLKCMVMITGYQHPIYDDALSSWRRKDYKTPTRGGLKDESCWMNYPEPTELHDYQYLGNTFKKREQIKLKQERWIKRLKKMPILERRAMIERLNYESNIHYPQSLQISNT
jgi:hypothetical protein